MNFQEKKKWTDIPVGDFNAGTQRLFNELGDDAAYIIELLKEDQVFRKNLVSFMKGRGHRHSVSQDEAKEIMGGNFLGVEEVLKTMGCYLNQNPRLVLHRVPFSRSQLEKYKDTHILLAVVPKSICDMADCTLYEGGVFSENFEGDIDKDFLRTRVESLLEWVLIRKEIVPGSTNQYIGKQQIEGEEPVNSRQLIFLKVTWFLSRKEHLFPNMKVMTWDRILIDFDILSGISMKNCPENFKSPEVGVITSITSKPVWG